MLRRLLLDCIVAGGIAYATLLDWGVKIQETVAACLAYIVLYESSWGRGYYYYSRLLLIRDDSLTLSWRKSAKACGVAVVCFYCIKFCR